MKNIYSDNQSESKKDGMKYITSSVYNIIKNGNGVTYNNICDNIKLDSKKTLHRRIYDVLNVMKAVQIIDKKAKKYYMNNNQESITKKKEEIAKLNDMKNVFEYLVVRNSQIDDVNKDKLYLPFMIIKTNPDSVIHCDTNEERSFFTFKSSEEIELVEDLDVLKELYLKENKVNLRKYYPKDSLDFMYF